MLMHGTYTEYFKVAFTANFLATITTTPDIVYVHLFIAGYTRKEVGPQGICTALDYLVSQAVELLKHFGIVGKITF